MALSNGKVVPWCERPYGLLIYCSNGYMSVAINCEGEPSPDSPSAFFNHYLLYAGKFSIVGKTEVVHHIENSSKLDQIGASMTRKVQLLGETLILSGDSQPEKKLLAFRIVWRKSLN